MKKISQRVLFRIIVICAMLACSLCGVNADDIEGQFSENHTPDVVFIPTPQNIVDEMLELAKVTKDDLVYDLGCGDGRIVVTAAKRYGCKAVGYDIDPKRVRESQENVEKNKVGHLVRIEQKNIFSIDLSKADVITLYLLPELNVKLIPQLEKLKPGSRIVSHNFAMKGVRPDKVVKINSDEDIFGHEIYLWTSPLKKSKETDNIYELADTDAFWIDDGNYKKTGLPYLDLFGNKARLSDIDVPRFPDYNETVDIEALEELSLNEPVTSLVEQAIAAKAVVLERIDASIEKGLQAYDTLEQMLISGEYGVWKRDDIIRAKSRIYFSTELEKYFKKVEARTSGELEDLLSDLRAELDKGG
ncbi:MAG: methyltransferase domain-containing protein [Planctomycetota bacterium]